MGNPILLRLSLIMLAALGLGMGSCESETQYYTTCGDPVCSGHSEQEGIPLCTDEMEGESCSEEGAICDPMNDCNALLVCAERDPKTQDGGCPISTRSVKEEIHYLQGPDLEKLHAQVLDLPLATYRYKTGDQTGQTRLGFIIEDQPQSLAVDQPQNMVDVYAYASMAMAALQVQAAEIEKLKAEIKNLKAAKIGQIEEAAAVEAASAKGNPAPKLP